ncbi:hypothetical protein [Pedobacter sp. AJM]|uniref:hypothetical protein n=1 Tax=Pedobacter sp. AJM TaxID=2003629 RepID=UPI000B4A830C|nr:hypothetical protein [Pedobacter sp. AJM]OWK69442.1 hypothetical protein CBW18_16640 [Pedobacter sp. AJM]
MNKKNLRYYCMSITLALILLMLGCKKDLQQINKSPEIINTPESVKILKVRKFISVISEVPFDKVTFNPTSNQYIFGRDHFDQKMIEDLYDKSNIYHAEYEKK